MYPIAANRKNRDAGCRDRGFRTRSREHRPSDNDRKGERAPGFQHRRDPSCARSRPAGKVPAIVTACHYIAAVPTVARTAPGNYRQRGVVSIEGFMRPSWKLLMDREMLVSARTPSAWFLRRDGRVCCERADAHRGGEPRRSRPGLASRLPARRLWSSDRAEASRRTRLPAPKKSATRLIDAAMHVSSRGFVRGLVDEQSRRLLQRMGARRAF